MWGGSGGALGELPGWSEKRKREIQFLINIVEPDPEYQPFFISDEATFLDLVSNEPTEISKKIESYFNNNFKINLSLPAWRIVDFIKDKVLNWPDSE